MAKYVSSKELYEVEILSGRYLKKPIDGIDYITDSLPLKIVGAGCHGKFIFALCTDETYLWSTLGMTGYWNSEGGKYERIRLDFSDGSKVFFNDMRNFGTMKFVKGKHEMLKKKKTIL